MLVYCLESLAQRSDEFSPSWEDYDDKERNRLDAVLGRVDPTEADNIRVILLESGRMRVQRRFIDFVARHTADSFFVDEARGIPGALRKSALRRAARNAYIIRSQYVHALRPIVDQLRIPQVGKRDAVFWEGEPYLTLSGLLRITLHVLGTFIEQGEQVETEDHDWRSELPGVIRMELAPQYWIWNADSFGQQEAARRLSAFLRHMEDISGKDVPIVDLGALMARIEQLMPQARPCYQPAMLGLYWLYNTIVVPEARRVGWKEFIEAWRAEADKCCVEMLVVRLLVSLDIPWVLDDCLKSYQEYDSRRFRKTALCLPGLFEILLLAGLANMALKAGQSQDYGELLERAILEGAGRHEIQKHLLECLTERRPVDLGSIVHWRTTHGSVR